MKGRSKWHIADAVIQRLVTVGALAAVALAVDAGLLDGELLDACLRVVRQFGLW